MSHCGRSGCGKVMGGSVSCRLLNLDTSERMGTVPSITVPLSPFLRRLLCHRIKSLPLAPCCIRASRVHLVVELGSIIGAAMLLSIILSVVLFQSAPTQPTIAWLNSSLIKTSTVNEWCRHCPDWNQTAYSFKLDDGTVYIAQSHKTLDVTVNGHTRLRFEKDGHVGDYVHIIDDAGKDRKLKIIQRVVPENSAEHTK